MSKWFRPHEQNSSRDRSAIAVMFKSHAGTPLFMIIGDSKKWKNEAKEPSPCFRENKKASYFSLAGETNLLCGDPRGTRTPVTALKGPCLNLLTMGPYW